MDDKENGGKRPPRLPPQSTRSSRDRNRGRSATRRRNTNVLTTVNSVSGSTRTSDTASSNSTGSHSRISGSGSRRPGDNMLGFDTIILRSQSPGNNNRGSSRSQNVNAPQKKMKTQSKKHAIKTPTRRQISGSNHSQFRTTTGRSRSRNRGTSLGSHSKASKSSIGGNSRARSSSRVSRASRGRSISQTRSVGSFVQYEVEPNVHHNAIVNTEIQCPAIVEMKENELFAKKAGVNFTLEGGDELTMEDQDGVDKSIQDDNYRGNFQFSPKYKKEAGSFLFDDDPPTNATFFRNEDEEGAKQILGSGTDLQQLKSAAGQLCVDWGGKQFETPTLVRRIIDFQFAQEKRRKIFGNERPWGILGLYDHLAAVRTDIEWAEIAACRRANGEPYKAWFEYIEEKKGGKNRPFFTLIVLTICTACMITSIAKNNHWQLEPLSVNPMLGPSPDTLVEMGAKDSRLIVQEGQAWRVLSAMVLHAGLIHFFLNMFALWFIGKAIEQSHGFFASMLLFIAPGIGGTILSAIFLPNFISVGASGGIFGLIGACLADIYMNWGLLFNDFVNGNEKSKHSNMIVLLVLLFDIIVNCLIGLTPFVDNFTHLGGMIFGFMCATSTMQRISTEMFDNVRKKETFWNTTKRNVSRYFGIIITLITMVASFSILMHGNGISTPCKSCKVISCVAFPPWAGYDDKWWYCDDCGGVTADATINPDSGQFDMVSLNCPYGDVYTMSIKDEAEVIDKAWMERQLPKWCRAHCDGI